MEKHPGDYELVPMENGEDRMAEDDEEGRDEAKVDNGLRIGKK